MCINKCIYNSTLQEIPMGFTAKCECGKSGENKHKNRFVNIIACKWNVSPF